MAQLQRLIITARQRFGQCIQLDPAQQHYLGRVLRLRPGDRFIAIDEAGQWWLTQLQSETSAAILDAIPVETESPLAITLLMALPKTGMDDVVRQATELGVQRIVPILSQRTLLNPSSQKLERWQRIAQEATEQAERQFTPEILPPQSWSDALQTWNRSLAACYLCQPRGPHPHLLTCLAPPLPHSLALAIGPEGGWTEAEITQALEAGYQPVSLGARILRAVTAPLVALSLLAAVSETQTASNA